MSQRAQFLAIPGSVAAAHVPFQHVAPLGTADLRKRVEGRAARKPWQYRVTAAIPHLDTIEPLAACIEVLRAQSERPYILVVDTGSPPEVCAMLEAMRAEDLEIHFIRGHGWQHTSEPVCAALDLAQSLCHSPFLFHTHADCFLRRRDFLANVAARCSAEAPAVGYRMSSRSWVTEEWKWMVGHTALMLHMPTIHRLGATWSMQRMFHEHGIAFTPGGWPDTETGFNYTLRKAGLVPVFIGDDVNFKRQIDENIDHVRSYAGSKMYSAEHFTKARGWMVDAIKKARERVNEWKS